jgi:hypothetical protein
MIENQEVGGVTPVRQHAAPAALDDSRWKCPKCGSTAVQVSLPTWYRETSGGTLKLINTDEEAEVQYWHCEACEEGGSGEPARA